MKTLVLPSLSILLLISCATPGNNPKIASESDTGTTRLASAPAAPKDVRFVCEDISTAETVPRLRVKLMVDGKESFSTTILGRDNDLGRDDFEHMGIPAEALDVAGAWWGGGGQYFYVILKDNEPVVFRGWQDEQQDHEGYAWEQVE